MGKKTVAFTIVSLNYISMANVLGKSFKKYHPDIEFIIFIVDKVSREVDLSKYSEFKTILVENIEVENIFFSF